MSDTNGAGLVIAGAAVGIGIILYLLRPSAPTPIAQVAPAPAAPEVPWRPLTIQLKTTAPPPPPTVAQAPAPASVRLIYITPAKPVVDNTDTVRKYVDSYGVPTTPTFAPPAPPAPLAPPTVNPKNQGSPTISAPTGEEQTSVPFEDTTGSWRPGGRNYDGGPKSRPQTSGGGFF